MPRRERSRYIKEPPLFTLFKPAGVERSKLVTITLSLDEYEAVKLADFLKYDHQEAADEMRISRSTFSRLVSRARKKVSEALVFGRALSIDGGTVHFRNNIYHCNGCGHRFVTTMEETMESCPACGSTDLTDHAEGFGHGRCCRHKGKRRGV